MEDKKLTIGIFNDSFFPMADGVISVVDNYAKRLLKYANVIVFAPAYPRRKFNDAKLPYKVIRCKSMRFPRFDYSIPIPRFDRKFLRELKNCQLDIVHIHSPFSVGKAGQRYAKKHKIPCVATMHTQFKQDIQKTVKSDKISAEINKKLIKVFDGCTECWAVNKEVARIYFEDYHCKRMPKIMNNATEMVLVDHQEACETINRRYNLDADEKVFIFVGRINTLKNILFIADSIAKVKELKPNFKFKMLFVGSGNDEKKLKARISELGIDDEVIMCGKIADRTILAKHYSRADLMLFPSTYDASSIVQQEAASQKTPTLFLEHTATSCMITDNQNGYLSKFDVTEYAKKIIEIIDNQELYKTVSENVYTTLYQNWDETVDMAFHMYEDLIEKNKQLVVS